MYSGVQKPRKIFYKRKLGRITPNVGSLSAKNRKISIDRSCEVHVVNLYKALKKHDMTCRSFIRRHKIDNTDF